MFNSFGSTGKAVNSLACIFGGNNISGFKSAIRPSTQENTATGDFIKVNVVKRSANAQRVTLKKPWAYGAQSKGVKKIFIERQDT